MINKEKAVELNSSDISSDVKPLPCTWIVDTGNDSTRVTAYAIEYEKQTRTLVLFDFDGTIVAVFNDVQFFYKE